MSTPYVRTKAKGPSIYYVSKGLDGSVQKKVSFADIQQCIYADKVGGPEKVQNVADVIFGWSLSEIQFIIKNPLLAERAVQLKKKSRRTKASNGNFLIGLWHLNQIITDLLCQMSYYYGVERRLKYYYAGSFNFAKSLVLLTLLKLTF